MANNPVSSITLWDFTSPRGESVLKEWADKEKLSKNDRAKLNQRLDRLTQIDFELAFGTSLLNGPVRKEIYKIKAHGQKMMRPFLCRGPFDKETEYTLLVGAIERDDELDPPTCMDDAEANRATLLKDGTRRKLHVRF